MLGIEEPRWTPRLQIHGERPDGAGVNAERGSLGVQR